MGAGVRVHFNDSHFIIITSYRISLAVVPVLYGKRFTSLRHLVAKHSVPVAFYGQM
jgi:hypothetical protein